MLAAVVKDGIVELKFRQGKISLPFLTAKFSPRNSPLAKSPRPYLHALYEGLFQRHIPTYRQNVAYTGLNIEVIFYHKDTASLARGVGSCNHEHPRDEVFGMEETIVACKPLKPLHLWLPSKRVYGICTQFAHGAISARYGSRDPRNTHHTRWGTQSGPPSKLDTGGDG